MGIKVEQKVGEPPVERVVLATAIRDIGEAARKLKSSGLNRRAIVLLLAESSKVPRRSVDAVLYAMEQLEKDYCR